MLSVSGVEDYRCADGSFRDEDMRISSLSKEVADKTFSSSPVFTFCKLMLYQSE